MKAKDSKQFRMATWGSWRCYHGDGPSVKGRLSACEIEIETDCISHSAMQRHLHTTPENRWIVVDEGSLRGGFELVSRAPMPVPELKLSLSQVGGAFEGISDTFRAAVHVHCNVQDFTREQYMKALIAYYLLEPQFYKFSGEGRDESVFCVPWYKGNDHVHKIARAYYSGSSVDWAESITGSPKYSGLNVRATAVYGSLEFRHMPTPTESSSTSLARIATYIDMCNEVITLALDTRFTGSGMLEFADYVISMCGAISAEHLCNVYSAIAIERPLDKLADGIATSTVRQTVHTRRSVASRMRRGGMTRPRVARRRLGANTMDFDAQMWAPSVASEYVAVDMEAVTEMAEDIMGEVFTDVLEVQ